MPSNLVQLSFIGFYQVTGSTHTSSADFYNAGDEACTVTDIIVDADLGYAVLTALPGVIGPGEHGQAEIIWTAGAVGVTPASTMTVICSDPGSPFVSPVSSESIAAGVKAVSVVPTAFVFANTKVGEDSATQIFVITNTGTLNVGVTGATFPTAFAAAAPVPSYTVTLAPGDSMSVGCKFSPVGQGFVSGNLSIASDAAEAPLVIPLSGIGFLITPAYIATGPEVVLAAFGNTVLEFDAEDLNCEEEAFVTRAVNLTMPGLEDSVLQMQLNHEAHGASTLTWDVENQRAQTSTTDIVLSTQTNDKIRVAFGNINASLTGEVITITLTHAADDGPVMMTSYILRHVPAGEVKPV